MGNAITLKRGVLVGAAIAVTAYAVWRRSRVAEVAIVRSPPVRPVQPEPMVPEVVAQPPQPPPAAHGQGRRRSLTHRGRHRRLSPAGWPKARPLARNRPAWPGATVTR